jgi:hypothetical protein
LCEGVGMKNAMLTSAALLPDWCSSPLVFLDQWRESLSGSVAHSQSLDDKKVSITINLDDLPLEARALLVAHTLEHLPKICSAMSDEQVALFLRAVVEDPCMYGFTSSMIASETRQRMVSAAPDMVALLMERTSNQLMECTESANPCASLLFMFWDCAVGWRVEALDFALSRKLMLEQIQSDHLPSIESGLHGIGHCSSRTLGSGQAEPYDWAVEVERHVLQRSLPEKLKQYARQALAREVQ